ncbi:hypothetical protein GCM10025762_39890 [Haloechinothrix salitolerans]
MPMAPAAYQAVARPGDGDGRQAYPLLMGSDEPRTLIRAVRLVWIDFACACAVGGWCIHRWPRRPAVPEKLTGVRASAPHQGG